VGGVRRVLLALVLAAGVTAAGCASGPDACDRAIARYNALEDHLAWQEQNSDDGTVDLTTLELSSRAFEEVQYECAEEGFGDRVR
jgi:hypothetical protein